MQNYDAATSPYYGPLPAITVGLVMGAFCDGDDTAQAYAGQYDEGNPVQCEMRFSQAMELSSSKFKDRYDRCRFARPSTAYMWVCIAANRDHAEAQERLGKMYRWGYEVVEENPVEAYKWSKLAAKNRNGYGAKTIASVEPKLTPEQIAEANRLVAEFKPDPADCEVQLVHAKPEVQKAEVQKAEVRWIWRTINNNVLAYSDIGGKGESVKMLSHVELELVRQRGDWGVFEYDARTGARGQGWILMQDVERKL